MRNGHNEVYHQQYLARYGKERFIMNEAPARLPLPVKPPRVADVDIDGEGSLTGFQVLTLKNLVTQGIGRMAQQIASDGNCSAESLETLKALVLIENRLS